LQGAQYSAARLPDSKLNLSYNDLPSTAIDQKGTMKACEVAEDKKKKKKRAMLGTTGGSSSGTPPKYRMVYMPPAGQPRRPSQSWGNR
jgi:hypothetical protein